MLLRRWASEALTTAAILLLCAVGCSRGSGPSEVRPAEHEQRFISATGQREILITAATGTPRSLILYMHGLQADETEILRDEFTPLRQKLLDNGYAIAASESHGNNAGNSASVADQARLVNDVTSRLPAITHIDVIGYSMGGLDALLVASGHVIPKLKSVALISPVTDQVSFLGQYEAVGTTAFGVSAGRLANAVKRWDPMFRPAGSYRGYQYAFWHGAGDTVVPRNNSVRMVERLATAGVVAPLHALAGNHGDLSDYDPETLVEFIGAAR